MGVFDRLKDAFPLTFAGEPVSSNGNGTHAHAAEAPPVEGKAIQLAPGGFWLPGNPELDRSTGTVNLAGLRAYSASALAFACMRYRAVKITEPPLWIAEEQGKEEVWLEGHELERILEEPNPDQEFSELLDTLQIYLDAFPGALIHKERDRLDRVARLQVYAEGPDFDALPADGVRFGKFRIRHGGGVVETYKAADVIYFRNPQGVAPLSAALSHIGITRSLRSAIESTLRNAIRPGASVTYPEDIALPKEVRDEIRGEIQAVYSGVLNDGKTMLLDRGGKLTLHDRKLADLAAGPVWREQEAAVCSVFQVHPVVVGAIVGLENAPWSNIQTAHEMFYDLFAFPRWAWLEKGLTKGLLREIDPNTRRFVRFDKGKVRALREDVARQVTAASRAVFWTVDQARAHTGQEPIGDERGDWLVADLKGGSAPGEPGEVKRRSSGEPAEAKRRSPRGMARQTARAVADAVSRAQEGALEIVARKLIAEDRDRILDAIDRTARSGKAMHEHVTREQFEKLIRDSEAALSGDRLEEWRREVKPWLEQLARNAASSAAAATGISFDLLLPSLLRYTDREAAWLVTNVTDTTKQEIRDALRKALEEGAPISPRPDSTVKSIRERIEELGTFSESRATLIARTETTRVTNGAQRETLSEYQAESGRKVTKEWLSAGPDGRTRDEHLELDGTRIGIDEEFTDPKTGDRMLAPSQPNCRCSLLYFTEGME